MAVSSDGVVTATVDAATASILLTVNFAAAGSPIVATAGNVYAVTVTETSAAKQVRGLSKAAAPGGIVSGIDHEVSFSSALSYVATAYNAAGALLGTSTAVAATLPAGAPCTWLKSLSTPSLSVSLLTSTVPEWAGGITQSVLQIIGRPDPIVVTDVRQYETATIGLLTQSVAESAELQALLYSPGPYLLQMPGFGEPDVYVTVGAHNRKRSTNNASDQTRVWSLPLTQVVRPAVAGWSVAIPGHTYADSTARWPLYSNRTGTYNLRATT